MSTQRHAKLSKLLFVTALLVTAGFWGSRGAVAKANADLLTAKRAATPPFLISGLEIDLENLLQHGTNRVVVPPVERRVVVVTSDDCPFCIKAVPAICALLEAQPSSTDVGWSFISLRGTSITTSLGTCARSHDPGRPVQTVEVTDRTSFMTRTGFLGTPVIALLDGRNRLVSSFNIGELDALKAAVSRP